MINCSLRICSDTVYHSLGTVRRLTEKIDFKFFYINFNMFRKAVSGNWLNFFVTVSVCDGGSESLLRPLQGIHFFSYTNPLLWIRIQIWIWGSGVDPKLVRLLDLDPDPSLCCNGSGYSRSFLFIKDLNKFQKISSIFYSIKWFTSVRQHIVSLATKWPGRIRIRN